MYSIPYGIKMDNIHALQYFIPDTLVCHFVCFEMFLLAFHEQISLSFPHVKLLSPRLHLEAVLFCCPKMFCLFEY